MILDHYVELPRIHERNRDVLRNNASLTRLPVSPGGRTGLPHSAQRLSSSRSIPARASPPSFGGAEYGWSSTPIHCGLSVKACAIPHCSSCPDPDGSVSISPPAARLFGLARTGSGGELQILSSWSGEEPRQNR